MAEFYFDATAVQVETAYSGPTPPDGRHLMMVVDSVIIKTKETGDQSIKFTLGIAKGDNMGASYEMWIPLRSTKNPKRVAQGQRQLADVCRALNKNRFRDTNELHDQPFWVELKTKGQYQNIVKVERYQDGDALPPQSESDQGEDSTENPGAW